MADVLDVPEWLLRPLPANASADAKLHAEIGRLASNLPASLAEIAKALEAIKNYSEYDAAANWASAHVWQAVAKFSAADLPGVRVGLLKFAAAHMVAKAQAQICRRLAKDPAVAVRRRARKLVENAGFHEVALPDTADGPWDATGWLRGSATGVLSRHKQGTKIQAERGLPKLSTVGELRNLIGIKSERQLGWFLLATDAEDGPYVKFTIPKRDQTEREICAPKPQLRWVQRQILDKILAKVATHDAAHGFIPGRSIVTNAAPHTSAALILKFDLKDFFPTIHYYRVMGLFTSLGYTVGRAKFSAKDDAREVAPTLARLCCYTPDPHQWGSALVPQGAPTSPAISNIVCRRLDARLRGLAERNKGVYTRYADDLTFSFLKDEVELGRFRWWVDQICHQEGFFVNQAKFRVIRCSQRQVVTGIVVNDALRIPREERRRFRAIVHNCKKHGIEAQARGHKKFLDYLRGYASYINMVHPEEGAELLEEVEALAGPETGE
ncbi:hypothetical protein AYO44_12570 [Planctomycetaceae bacterium SCGC AG-212-F19]|nr:hypothetical protein AYO44_12570 [Planctomycetaceae bacterium SCGC AG-212-F19]